MKILEFLLETILLVSNIIYKLNLFTLLSSVLHSHKLYFDVD